MCWKVNVLYIIYAFYKWDRCSLSSTFIFAFGSQNTVPHYIELQHLFEKE